MPIQQALNQVIVEFNEANQPDGEVRASGLMSFGAALEGPPGRLHGGHHAIVRAFPILERLQAHDDARTFPCSVDVTMLRGLPLNEAVPFEATYRADGDAWQLTTRFQGTDRLIAHAHSLPDAPFMDAAELEHWRALYTESCPTDNTFEMFGVPLHLAPKMVWIESRDPLQTLPESQHAALVEADGTFGPAFVSTQLDTVGAVARAAIMRHSHFTKHVELHFAAGTIPAETHLLCLADRTRIEEDPLSDTRPVEIKGQLYGTAHTPVALVDATFEHVFATGRVTVHPIDADKFEAVTEMGKLRKDPSKGR